MPRPRLRSCRRPFHPSPPSGPYRLPRPVLDRLEPALAPARNRDAALALAVFLARYWTAPARLGQPFQVDRRALCGHRDLPLTEARVRGAVAALEAVGFLTRITPEPGRRYQRTPEGLQRQPLAFHFAADFRALFEAANARPRRGARTSQDGRWPRPAVQLPAAPPRPSWRPSATPLRSSSTPPTATGRDGFHAINSPKKTSSNPAFVDLGELKEGHSQASSITPDERRDSGLEAALKRLGDAIRGR